VVIAIGVWSFSRVTVQGELRHRVLERQGDSDEDGKNGFIRILRTDNKYARYQLHQFTSGVAAMMLEPVLVYLVSNNSARVTRQYRHHHDHPVCDERDHAAAVGSLPRSCARRGIPRAPERNGPSAY
jgi:hypothetical protein